MKKLIIFFVMLLSTALGSGCAAISPFALVSPIVTGVVMWYEGEAHKYYNEEADLIYRSTKSSLKELNLPVTKDTTEKNGYYLVAGDKDRFKIHIRQVKPHITEVSIRINFMGDKPFAELVYKTIDNSTDTIEFKNGRPVKSKTFDK